MVFVYKIIILQTVKLRCNPRSLSSPPEPAALRLMERTPQNRDVLFQKRHQAFCNDIQVMEKSLPFFRMFCQHLLRVKFSFFRIKALVISAQRGKPVPCEGHNTAAFSECQRLFQRAGVFINFFFAVLVPRFITDIRGTGKQFKSPERRFLSRNPFYFCNFFHGLRLGMLSRDNSPSPGFKKKLKQLFSIFCCVWIYWFHMVILSFVYFFGDIPVWFLNSL